MVSPNPQKEPTLIEKRQNKAERTIRRFSHFKNDEVIRNYEYLYEEIIKFIKIIHNLCILKLVFYSQNNVFVIGYL